MKNTLESDIDKTKEELIREWFYNIAHNVKNETILILEYQNSLIELHREIERNIIEGHQNFFFPKETDNLLKNDSLKKKSIIITLEPQDPIKNENSLTYTLLKNRSFSYSSIPEEQHNKKIFSHRLLKNRSFLYLSRVHDRNFYSNMKNYTQTNCAIPTPEDKRLYLIQKQDPYALIEDLKTVDNMYRFINNMIKVPIFNLWNRTGICLFHGTSYRIEGFDAELLDDLNILECHKLLPARLAVLIYRIALLDNNANIVKAGRYFNERLGSKSKLFYFGHPRIKKNTIVNPGLLMNKFKAYDLEANERDWKARRDIAINLIKLNLSELNMEIICEVTKLPISEVRKLEDQLSSNLL